MIPNLGKENILIHLYQQQTLVHYFVLLKYTRKIEKYFAPQHQYLLGIISQICVYQK